MNARCGEAIIDIAGRFPRYGSRKIKEQLKRAPYRIVVGRHRVRRLMREMDLLVKPKRRRSTTDSRHGLRRFPNLVRGVKASRPDQIWVADITYIRLRSHDIYLAVIMDQYSRSIRGHHLKPVAGPGTSAVATSASSTAIPGAGNPSLRPRDPVRSKSLCQAIAG